MRKQMKIAAVVSATALLAIGASFTSMAAAKTGTWTNEDGTWYCYDKNGDVYENEFCLSNGKEFYVGDDGALVYSEWVEYDGEMYYINSEGAKTTSAWKWLTPYEDEDADEAWYWFQASGKRAEDKKVAINGQTYYFDAEGKMLTGWVDLSNEDTVTAAEKGDENNITSLVYCDETGARVVKDWVYTYAPGVDVEEDDLDQYSEGWYYLKALGAPTTGKASSINGQTYFFTTAGRMLTGWVGTADGEEFVSIDNENQSTTLAQYAEQGYDVYFACTTDGHAKKNKWIYVWDNMNWYEADPDVDKTWFWIEKNGKVYIPNAASASDASKVSFEEGELVTGTDTNATFKAINNNIYAFNNDGAMLSGIKLIDGDYYYFGGAQDGARKIGAQSISDNVGDSYKFYFGTEDDKGYSKGVGVTGAKNGKLYENGLLVTATGDYKYEVVNVGGLDYIVNKSGSIQTSKQAYYDDGEFIINAKSATFNPNAGTAKGSVTGLSKDDPKTDVVEQ